MPGFDQTGPRGDGPMTGGGFGFCGTGRSRSMTWNRLGFGRRGYPRGRGFRRQMNQGYGFGGGFQGGNYLMGAAPASPDDEARWLKADAQALEDQLAVIRKRIEALEKSDSSSD